MCSVEQAGSQQSSHLHRPLTSPWNRLALSQLPSPSPGLPFSLLPLTLASDSSSSFLCHTQYNGTDRRMLVIELLSFLLIPNFTSGSDLAFWPSNHIWPRPRPIVIECKAKQPFPPLSSLEPSSSDLIFPLLLLLLLVSCRLDFSVQYLPPLLTHGATNRTEPVLNKRAAVA